MPPHSLSDRPRVEVDDAPEPLHARAMDNLTFIRRTMERSAAFTAVPGWGTVGIGGLAVAASIVASLRLTTLWWVGVWIVTACAGLCIALATLVLKARRNGIAVTDGPARRFLLGMAPALIAGGILTLVFYRPHLEHLMPGMWLLLYGVAVIAGGTFSIRIVPLMGMTFLALGGCAFVTLIPQPQLSIAGLDVGDLFMAAGFGVAHIVFGTIIARRYGG